MNWNSGHLDVVKYLVGKGANIEAKTNRGWTPLYFSIVVGNLKFLYWKKKMHTKLWYYHFLNEFVRNLGNHEIGKFLIEKGADINAKENNGETALHRSAFHGNWYLKRKKCKQNKNIDLIWNSGSASAAQLLLENGANVGIKDKYGQTALGYLLKRQKY